MIAQLAVLVSTNARLKQFLKVISIKLILKYALTVVLALMFAQLRLFIQNKSSLKECKTRLLAGFFIPAF
jgi:hypothetical protein